MENRFTCTDEKIYVTKTYIVEDTNGDEYIVRVEETDTEEIVSINSLDNVVEDEIDCNSELGIQILDCLNLNN